MATYRFKIASGLERNQRYRVDTGSTNGTAAAITGVDEGQAVPGAFVKSDGFNGGVAFNGPVDTLYLRPVDSSGTVIGSSFVTATGVLRDDKGPTPQVGVVALTGQSGAVVLDLSRGQLFDVALTGNVTGWSFTNPGRLGQEVTVVWRQDATGSRTLAGADAGIRLAGGALTLTTTASKADTVTFKQVAAGVFREISRALNQS